MNQQDMREALETIVTRRNQIVHSVDMDPSYPSERWPIEAQMVEESVSFIERIAESIYSVVAQNT